MIHCYSHRHQLYNVKQGRSILKSMMIRPENFVRARVDPSRSVRLPLLSEPPLMSGHGHKIGHDFVRGQLEMWVNYINEIFGLHLLKLDQHNKIKSCKTCRKWNYLLRCLLWTTLTSIELKNVLFQINCHINGCILAKLNILNRVLTRDSWPSKSSSLLKNIFKNIWRLRLRASEISWAQYPE